MAWVSKILGFAAGLFVAVVIAYGNLAAVGRWYDNREDQARQQQHKGLPRTVTFIHSNKEK